MAWIRIDEPGTKYGPCLGACQHIDCGAMRKAADSICRICNKDLGYEKPLSDDPKGDKGDMAHFWCLVKEVEPKEGNP